MLVSLPIPIPNAGSECAENFPIPEFKKTIVEAGMISIIDFLFRFGAIIRLHVNHIIMLHDNPSQNKEIFHYTIIHPFLSIVKFNDRNPTTSNKCHPSI